jgi:hypothetical protein
MLNEKNYVKLNTHITSSSFSKKVHRKIVEEDIEMFIMIPNNHSFLFLFSFAHNVLKKKKKHVLLLQLKKILGSRVCLLQNERKNKNRKCYYCPVPEP